MMLDATPTPQGPNPDQMIIANVGDGYWVLQGEEHLGAMLTKDAPYPTPIFCVTFESEIDFHMLLSSENVKAADLWTVHTDIIDRLKRENELVAMTPPAS